MQPIIIRRRRRIVQVQGLPVYGVAIPTVTGLRKVLGQLGAENGTRRVDRVE